MPTGSGPARFHAGHPRPHRRSDITDEAKRRIFFDNPLRFYPRLRARVDEQPSQAAAAAA